MKINEILNLNAKALTSELFSLAKDEMSGLSTEEKLKRSSEIFQEVCKILKETEELNEAKLNAVTTALNRAVSYNEEEYLYKIMYEADRLIRQIDEQKKSIKSLVWRNVETLKNTSQNCEGAELIQASLNDTLSKDLELLGILKETCEFAFISVIEGGRDINDLSREISKNIVYNAIKEGEFKKERFINIARVVIRAAANVANESKAYASELLGGVIEGTDDGVSKAISEFRDTLRFAPEEIGTSLRQNMNDLSSAGAEFDALLSEIARGANEPAGSIISGFAGGGAYIAKFKKISEQTIAQISDKLADLKAAGVNMENLKREVVELEKIAGEKLGKITNAESFESAKTRAHELGSRIYEAAKTFIDNAKKK